MCPHIGSSEAQILGHRHPRFYLDLFVWLMWKPNKKQSQNSTGMDCINHPQMVGSLLGFPHQSLILLDLWLWGSWCPIVEIKKGAAWETLGPDPWYQSAFSKLDTAGDEMINMGHIEFKYCFGIFPHQCLSISISLFFSLSLSLYIHGDQFYLVKWRVVLGSTPVCWKHQNCAVKRSRNTPRTR